METYTPKEAIERKISDFEFKYRIDIDLTDPSLWDGFFSNKIKKNKI